MPLPFSLFVDVNISVQDGLAERFNFGVPIGIFDHSVTANRQDGPYTSVAEVTAAGFTSGAAPEVNFWATSVFAQENGVESVMIGREDAGDADWTATLDAVEAAGANDFYFINVETRAEAEILLVAAWTEARTKIAICQSSDAGILAGTPGNVALDLQAAGYNRTALIYHNTDSGAANGYLDGAWTSYGGGFNLDEPGGVGAWNYNQLSGITPDSFTSAEASEVLDADANLFHRLSGLNFTWEGTLASGRQIETQTTVDWFQKRSEEAVLQLFVSTPTKIPFDNGGITQVASVVQGVLDRGVAFGHFLGNPGFEPVLTIPDISQISAADREAGVLRLTSTTNHVTLAGQIRRLVFNISVSF